MVCQTPSRYKQMLRQSIVRMAWDNVSMFHSDEFFMQLHLLSYSTQWRKLQVLAQCWSIPDPESPTLAAGSLSILGNIRNPHMLLAVPIRDLRSRFFEGFITWLIDESHCEKQPSWKTFSKTAPKSRGNFHMKPPTNDHFIIEMSTRDFSEQADKDVMIWNWSRYCKMLVIGPWGNEMRIYIIQRIMETWTDLQGTARWW